MRIEQIYTGCLAHGAYYIESDGEAAIIDPLREVAPYVDRAKRSGAQIRYVLETHFHADFVSGHLDLAAKTGAEIIYGPTARPAFRATVATDGQQLVLGKVTIIVLHTPGHTMESCCFLLRDETGKDIALFTGDTLFIGDVGRPDLAQQAAGKTKEELAGILYDSLHKKILPLADDIVIYPAHGAGSACGKQMSDETSDTLGHQKKTNYALADISRQDFISQVLSGLGVPPSYFPKNALLNRQGYESFDVVLGRGMQPLSPAAFEATAAEETMLVLDTRSAAAFAQAHIRGAVNIGLDSSFAPWVGALITDISQPILLLTDPGREEEALTRLSRVGYDNCRGYLQGGMETWNKAGLPVDTIPVVNAHELQELMKISPVHLIDVRRKKEYELAHIKGAFSLPLDHINERMEIIDKDKYYYVYCAAGYRSMIFISLLRARGYHKLIDVQGGFKSLRDSGSFAIEGRMQDASE